MLGSLTSMCMGATSTAGLWSGVAFGVTRGEARALLVPELAGLSDLVDLTGGVLTEPLVLWLLVLGRGGLESFVLPLSSESGKINSDD